MLIDLHVHTKRTSGSSLTPQEAVGRARELGLDGLCFTDVDTVEGFDELLALRAQEPGVQVFGGLEVTTDHGRILCFLPSLDRGAGWEAILAVEGERGRPIREVLAAVRALDGAAVVAHPYDRDLPRPMGDMLFTLEGISAVEGIAGTRHVAVNELGIEAAAHLSVPVVGGSAAGAVEEIGTAATLFRDPVEDEEGLVEALLHGKVWAVAIGTPPRFHGDDQPPRPRDDRGRGRRGRSR